MNGDGWSKVADDARAITRRWVAARKAPGDRGRSPDDTVVDATEAVRLAAAYDDATTPDEQAAAARAIQNVDLDLLRAVVARDAELVRLRDNLDATSHALDDARARLDDVADAFELPRAWDGDWGDRVRALVAAPAGLPWRSEPPTRAEFDATPEAAGRHARLILTRSTDEPSPRLGFFVWLKDNGLCALDAYGDEYAVSGWEGLGYEFVLCTPRGVPLPWPAPAPGGPTP